MQTGCKILIFIVTPLIILLPAGCRSGLPKAAGAGVGEVFTPDTVTVSLVMGGDLMQHRPQVDAALGTQGYDYTRCFQYVEPIFRDADISVVNLETTISADGRYSGYPFFSSPQELAATLSDMGIDAVTLANNHICDKGRPGIIKTIQTLQDNSIEYTGVFTDSTDRQHRHPLILERKGLRIALYNYTYGTNGMPVPEGIIVNRIDTTAMKKDLAGRDSTLFTVLFLHWGEEYATQPSQEQTRVAAFARRMGVDVVIGSHPHVIQPSHIAEDSSSRFAVYYSLGNLVSNQRWRRSDGGAIAHVELKASGGRILQTDYAHSLAWVHTPYVAGRKDYIIVPAAIGDTLFRKTDPAFAAYTLFTRDARRLLTGTQEINPFTREVIIDEQGS